MKFYIVDDEHDLYRSMFADLLNMNDSDVSELPKFRKLPQVLNRLRLLHFNDRINRHLWLPGKSLWNSLYYLSNFEFDEKEVYWIIFLNGTLRNYYPLNYLKKIKQKHKNLKLAMIMYDSLSNKSTKRAVEKISAFDKVFSFDKGDCEKMGFEYIYSTFSVPHGVSVDGQYKTDAFFIGAAENRLPMLQKTLKKVSEFHKKCEFRIVGVSNEEKKYEEIITYNQKLSYEEVLMYSYNTDCLIEVVRPGQTGVSLRTCEAIVFNKKLLTNNKEIKKMPFYNPEYIYVFENEEDIKGEFLLNPINVDYGYDGWFSPMEIIKRLRKEV